MSNARIVIAPETVAAYERASYRVDLPHAPFALRLGVRSGPLLDLHRAAGVRSSVFVTACNPFGEKRVDDVNVSAMRRLRERLDARAVRWIGGRGEADDNSWPAEPSILALGLSRADAQALCVEFEQNAVVFMGHDAIPRLLFHPRVAVASAGD